MSRPSEVIREARAYVRELDTKRPETPRHRLGSEKWREYYAQGEPLPTIDRHEQRPATRQSIRLEPLPTGTQTTKKRATSAQQKLDSLCIEFGSAQPETVTEELGDRLAKSIERAKPSPEQRELILTKCKELLDYPRVSNKQRYAVARTMLQMRLGPTNQAALGATLHALSASPSYLAEHSSLIEGIVKEYESGSMIECLNTVIGTDVTLRVCLKQPELIRSLRRCLGKLLTEYRSEPREDLVHKVQRVLETIRSLLDVTSFVTKLEQEESKPETSKLCEIWLQCCEEFADSRPIVYLIARILSKSTESELLCCLFRQPFSTQTLASSAETHLADYNLLVRLLFALGNCLAADGRCRVSNPRLVRSLRRILNHYCKKWEPSSDQWDPKLIDVFLKLIRTCANYALDRQGAVALLSEPDLIKILLKMLNVAVKHREGDEITKYVLAALSNLVYFAREEYAQFASDTTHAFINCLMKSNLRITSECCRALGNLSHYDQVLEVFESAGADRLLHALLDSSDLALVVNVVGIFINFTLKRPKLKAFEKPDSIKKLLDAVKDFNDWHLSTLTLQLVWNILRNATEIENKLRHEITSTIDFINEHAQAPEDLYEAQDQRLFGEISEKVMEKLR